MVGFPIPDSMTLEAFENDDTVGLCLRLSISRDIRNPDLQEILHFVLNTGCQDKLEVSTL